MSSKKTVDLDYLRMTVYLSLTTKVPYLRAFRICARNTSIIVKPCVAQTDHLTAGRSVLTVRAVVSAGVVPQWPGISQARVKFNASVC